MSRAALTLAGRRGTVSARTVLVVGASRGLGFELCRLLLRAGGWHVVAAARAWDSRSSGAAAELRRVCDSTSLSPGKSVTALTTLHGCDVVSTGSRAELPARVSSALRTSRLDAIVNAAGVAPQGWGSDAFELALATNAVGPLRLAEVLVPTLSEAAHVIHVSSALGASVGLHPEYARRIVSCSSVDDIEALRFVASDSVAAGELPCYKVGVGLHTLIYLASDPSPSLS